MRVKIINIDTTRYNLDYLDDTGIVYKATLLLDNGTLFIANEVCLRELTIYESYRIARKVYNTTNYYMRLDLSNYLYNFFSQGNVEFVGKDSILLIVENNIKVILKMSTYDSCIIIKDIIKDDKSLIAEKIFNSRYYVLPETFNYIDNIYESIANLFKLPNSKYTVILPTYESIKMYSDTASIFNSATYWKSVSLYDSEWVVLYDVNNNILNKIELKRITDNKVTSCFKSSYQNAFSVLYNVVMLNNMSTLDIIISDFRQKGINANIILYDKNTLYIECGTIGVYFDILHDVIYYNGEPYIENSDTNIQYIIDSIRGN